MVVGFRAVCPTLKWRVSPTAFSTSLRRIKLIRPRKLSSLQGPRCAPIVLPSQLDESSSDADLSEEKPKLRERVRDRIQTVQLKAAEKFVHVVGRGLDACNNAFARSYALMAKVGTMRQVTTFFSVV